MLELRRVTTKPDSCPLKLDGAKPRQLKVTFPLLSEEQDLMAPCC